MGQINSMHVKYREAWCSLFGLQRCCREIEKNVLQVNYMVHTELWGGGGNQGPKSFFQWLNFPTIWHKMSNHKFVCSCAFQLSCLQNNALQQRLLLFKELSQIFKAHANQAKVCSITPNKKRIRSTRKSDKITSKIEVTTVKSESVFGGGKRKTAKWR